MKAIIHRPVCLAALAALAALLASAPPASAQGPTTAFTDPVGYEALILHANTTSLIGTRLLPPTVAAGAIDAVTGAVVTDTGNDFGALLDPANRYTIELRSGAAASLRVIDIVSFSGNTLTLAESGVAAPGTSYFVRAILKLSEVWGGDFVTPLGFTMVANFNPDTGDRVLISDGQGRFKTYYCSSHPASLGWVNAATGMLEDPYIRYPAALLIQCQGTSITQVFSGEVKVTDTALPLTWRFSPICAVNPVASLTTLGLAATIQPGAAETADIVWSQDLVTGQMGRYFYSDGNAPGLTSGWRMVDAGPGLQNSDQGEVMVSSSVIIRQRDHPTPRGAATHRRAAGS